MPPGWQLIQTDGVATLPADARALLDSGIARSMQLGSAWLHNFVEQLGSTAAGSPQFLTLTRDGRAVAVLPVAVRVATLYGRQVASLSNYYSSLYAPALSEQAGHAELAFLIKALLSGQQPLHRLQFSPMDPASREYRALRDALRDCGLHAAPYFCFGNWYLPNAQVPWNAYLQGRSSELRNTLHRMGRRFERDGGSLEIITGGARLEEGIAAYQRVYGLSWKHAEAYPEFVAGLMRTCAAQGWLRLGLAWLNDQPIAAQLWIAVQGRAEIYKLAYDERFKRYSPGSLLTARLMQHVLEHDRVQEVDYLTGDDDYKAAWMTHRRERWGLVAHNPRTAMGAAGISREWAGRLWRSLFPRPRGAVRPTLTNRHVA